MAIISLFGFDVSGAQSKSININAQERLNLYVEVRPDPDRTRTALYCTPGLADFVDLGSNPARGIYAVGDYLYVVQNDRLRRINNAGAISATLGTLLTSTGYVSIIDNGLQLLMVDGTYGYVYVFATGEFARLENSQNVVSSGSHSGVSTATGFPTYPSTCAFQGSYFIVSQGGDNQKFYISASYDAFDWDALDFASAEADPDNMIRVIADHGELVLFGEFTTEFWGNTGAQSFPYSAIQGSATEWGLAAKQAVAKFDNSLLFLGRNRQGQVQVVQILGHNVQRVSTHELEARIQEYPTVLDATAFSYMLDGHAMFQINFNSGNESWLYDGASSAVVGMPVWSKVQSFGLGRHRVERAVPYLGRLVGSDFTNGMLYEFDPNLQTDAGDPIVSRVRTRHYFEDDEASTVAQAWLDVETGVGTQTGQGLDPQVMFRYSKDGGHTWSDELWRSLGATGKWRTRPHWNRLGAARNWVYEWSISDPVKRAFINAGLKTNSRKKRVVT